MINHHGGTDCLAGETRRRAPRKNRDSFLRGNPDDRGEIVAGARQNHAKRLDLIETRISRIKHPRTVVKQDLGTGLPLQSALKSFAKGIWNGSGFVVEGGAHEIPFQVLGSWGLAFDLIYKIATDSPIHPSGSASQSEIGDLEARWIDQRPNPEMML